MERWEGDWVQDKKMCVNINMGHVSSGDNGSCSCHQGEIFGVKCKTGVLSIKWL